MRAGKEGRSELGAVPLVSALAASLDDVDARRALTARDLQDVLSSIRIPIVLLDSDLTIRFFTPEMSRCFNLVETDIGMPLWDRIGLASDQMLGTDAGHVMQSLTPVEREIESLGGVCYIRRIFPYFSSRREMVGTVIAFVDLSDQKRTAEVLECARAQAEASNVAKSRSLAAACHDLRQPLQNLVLLQELLAKEVVGDKAEDLVERLDQALGNMSGMLNGLLDLNRIETGSIRAEYEVFPICALLHRIISDLVDQAEARQIALEVSPCSMFVRSDPQLLEQMIRNLLSNAIKFTKRGRVLLGCRRRKGTLSIEIWDTGIGIPEDQLRNIFEEYHQLDGSARNRGNGRGLGLSIVKRLGRLLHHPVRVRSKFGKGSVFSIDIEPSYRELPARHDISSSSPIVYLVNHDRELRRSIRNTLDHDGWVVEDHENGASFLQAYKPGCDACLLIDTDGPGMSGSTVLSRLQDLGHSIPVIMMARHGDVATTVAAMKAGAVDVIEKPIHSSELLDGVARVMRLVRMSDSTAGRSDGSADRIPCFTRRQQEVMQRVLAGHPSKNIAVDLGISRRTVESHRASIMKKAGVRSLPALARLAIAGGW